MLKCLTLKREMFKILVEKVFRSIAKLLIFTLSNETWRWFDEKLEWFEVDVHVKVEEASIDIREDRLYSGISDFLLWSGIVILIFFVFVPGISTSFADLFPVMMVVSIVASMIVLGMKDYVYWCNYSNPKPDGVSSYNWEKEIFIGNLLFEFLFHLFINPVIKLIGAYKRLKRKAIKKIVNDSEEE